MDARLCVLLSVALLLRLALLCFGVYQDQNLQLKYTDVDYHVFTDASRFITQGQSPYVRSTYRYTPLLALVLVPGVLLSWVHCGKLLFVGCDLLSALLLFRLLVLRGSTRSSARVLCGLWLFNPLTVAVSTRGSAESLLAALVLSSLLCLESRRRLSAALLFGLAVHMKIYPVTYALPIALSLTGAPARGRGLIQNLIRCVSRDLLQFAAVSGSVFFALNLIFYSMYGWDFLQESYLYHLTRRDIRHNFSPYFYMLYVTAEHHWSGALALVCFLPQMLLLLLSSLAFRRDLPFCCFIHTAVFVSFNKVCTSQYFLWYLCLLPLVLPRLTLGLRRGLGLLLLWFVGQALWLSPAYYLEFEGWNTFALIWIAGLLFLLINSLILGQIISHYRPAEALLKKTD
ncbi:GPI mannosyltransferase 1-like [Sinocyclocheilus grahami]|uniref:GPI alpha-1,4-mannosyltransferase I, catalytic subunit n=1 Tax=Sinocyclocheilus grahami TaxID=75366 RepID=A0A672R5H5_SINGR|nr:PREDICTED: GPI mannosyltransferase 1-like [Sinocyclocheilus grahami]XP_016115203.1 PREDICTED: GPI mannosyltransferase 1-like [Sinocyclocheilus grahami]XP_016115204.1 PREDICTED: GPI mannosyltransferase 1-like [Sinocyclocheilus grahami]